MSALALEAFLARIYVDAEERARFLADPRGVAAAAGLSVAERDALAAIDRDGLQLAAQSFARKRERLRPPSGIAWRVLRWFRRRR